MPEYRGATLGEAIRAATAPERARREGLTTKRTVSCTDLLFDIVRHRNELDDYSDELTTLESRIEELRESARRAKRDAALSALGGVLGSIRRVIRAVNKLKNKSVKELEITDIENFLAVFGPFGVALSLRDALNDEAEARRLEAQMVLIESSGKRIGTELMKAIRAYDAAGCSSGRANLS